MALKRWDKLLTATEVAEREECETVIDETKLSFVRCGDSLLKIKDKRLYRNTHGTFEEYCQDKHGWTRQRAYQINNAAATALRRSQQIFVNNC